MQAMKVRFSGVFFLLAALQMLYSPAWAQQAPVQSPSSSAATSRTATRKTEESYQLLPGEDPENRLISPFLKHLAGDQKQFWTAPTRLQVKDLKWIVPSAGVFAALIASDSWFAKQVNPAHVQTSLHISDYGAYSLIGLGGASFLLGHIKRDDHLQEAGLLSGEAAVNATAVAYVFKEVSQRERPNEGNQHGNFFYGGASFPSEHSAIAWSIASVWAHEYPGWLSQFAAYGLASTITLTRVTAQQHFPSDVIVGSALGWYFGRQVYRAHHDPEVGGTGWGSLFDHEAESVRDPNKMASPYVPMGSWVYPLFDRLIALGYIRNAHTDIRPWTRMECARMVEEAGERLEDESNSEGIAVYNALADEFKSEVSRRDGVENAEIRLESIYTRGTEVNGTPLRDGYHFGQTVVNDYGRPYWTGFNNVTGVTGWAVAGPLAFYVDGEYQHAPAAPSQSPRTLQATAAVDFVPVAVPNSVPQIDRFRLMTATAAYQIGNVQFSFGQQDLWLGPTQAGPLLFTDNSEPVPMMRIDSVSPFEIPGLSRVLGPARTQFFLAQLSGQQWSNDIGPGLPSQPWLHGTKISFNPTENFEFGMGFTAQFGGTGNPFTWHNFFRTFYSHTSGPDNPGKRLSEFDFTYRIPGLRKWLTLYTDSMVIDEYSPIGSTRPVINPGIYMPQLPKLHKMQLRLEGATSDLNVPSHFGPAAVYFDTRYKSGYTYNANLIGNWVGRRGRGEQAWATYSLSPRNQIQFIYRHNDVDKAFLNGGRLQDLSVGADFMGRHNLELSGYVQYETWSFPALSATSRTDIASSLQLTFWPHWSKKMH